jgi:hypothetical protein
MLPLLHVRGPPWTPNSWHTCGDTMSCIFMHHHSHRGCTNAACRHVDVVDCMYASTGSRLILKQQAHLAISSGDSSAESSCEEMAPSSMPAPMNTISCLRCGHSVSDGSDLPHKHDRHILVRCTCGRPTPWRGRSPPGWWPAALPLLATRHPALPPTCKVIPHTQTLDDHDRSRPVEVSVDSAYSAACAQTDAPVALVPDFKVLTSMAPVVGCGVRIAHPQEAL